MCSFSVMRGRDGSVTSYNLYHPTPPLSLQSLGDRVLTRRKESKYSEAREWNDMVSYWVGNASFPPWTHSKGILLQASLILIFGSLFELWLILSKFDLSKIFSKIHVRLQTLWVRHFIMAFSSLPSSNVPSRTVPNLISGDRRGWFAQDSRPLIDWDQARIMRRVGLYSPPSSASPHPEAHTFPRWPCLLCNIKLKSAEGVSRHVEIAHGQCDEFFRRTTEFCPRCTICC